MSHLDVIHDPQNREFFLELVDVGNVKAILQYEYNQQDDVYDLYHTEVPEQLRGRGIAKHLAKAALDFVSQKGSRAILSCTYLQKYHRENPCDEHKNAVIQ